MNLGLYNNVHATVVPVYTARIATCLLPDLSIILSGFEQALKHQMKISHKCSRWKMEWKPRSKSN